MSALVAELNLGAGEIVGLTWDWFVKENTVEDDDASGNDGRGSKLNVGGGNNRRLGLNR